MGILRLLSGLLLLGIRVVSQEPFPAPALNVPVERDLAGGTKHLYSLPALAGQYIQLVVEQRGIDVLVALFGPNGQQVLSVDSPNGTQGPEPVFLVTESSGIYRLEVQALEKTAPPGRYEIRLLVQREATEKDRHRLSAIRNYNEAEQLRTQQKVEALRESISKYEAAIPLYQAADDPRGEATALNNLAWVHLQLGTTPRAIECLQQALEVWQRLGDRREEANALNNLGQVHKEIGEYSTSLSLFERAIAGARATSNRALEASLQHNIGNVHFAMNEAQLALNAYNRALPLLREVGDRSLEASTMSNLGTVYRQLGDLQKALDIYLQLQPAVRALGNQRELGASLHNLGDVYGAMGDIPRALDQFTQALAIWQKLGYRLGEAATLNEIGKLYFFSGRLAESVSSLQQALQVRDSIGDRRGQAQTLTNLGAAYKELNDLERANDSWQRALILWQNIKNPTGEAVTRSHLAGLQRASGNLDSARKQVETAISLLESSRSKVVSQDLRASFRASQQGIYEFYISLLMELQERVPTSNWQAAAMEASEKARARGLLELLAEAKAEIREGVESSLLERERELQRQLNNKEQERQRLLNTNPATEPRATVEKELRSLIARYDELQAEIRLRSPRYAGLTQPQPLKLTEIQQQVLDRDTLLLEYSLGSTESFLFAVSRDEIKSYRLPGRAEIETIARSYYEALSSENGQLSSESGLRLSQILLTPVSSRLADKRLLIVADGALQYLPFGALPEPAGEISSRGRQSSNSPGKQALIINHEIVYLPSASSLALLRQDVAGRKAAPKALALFADPVFTADDSRLQKTSATRETETRDLGLARALRESGFSDSNSRIPRLPGTRREAAAIAAFVPAADRRQALDFEASRSIATSPELGQYRIVHFATHGLLNSQHPELSGLVLSLVDPQGKPQDGFLRLHEIYNLRIPAELIVLSACQTGLGRDIRGEGLLGLTRGFMYAGAARVTASLWKVDDRATAELMKYFYKGMLVDGLRPAAALRAAQVALLRQPRWQNPYFWAAFVLQGEFR